MHPIFQETPSPAARYDGHGVESVVARSAAGVSLSLQDDANTQKIFRVVPTPIDHESTKTCDPTAEASIIAFIGKERFAEIEDEPLEAKDFSVPHWGIIYQSAREIFDAHNPVCINAINDWLGKNDLQGFRRSIGISTAWVNWPLIALEEGGTLFSTALNVRDCCQRIAAYARNREETNLRKEFAERTIDLPELIQRYEQLHGANGHDLLELDARRFDINALHERPSPVFTLNGQSISTAGNLTSIFAQAKAGKSAVVGAIIGSIISLGSEGDFLGWKAVENPNCAAVIHFDTEQSPHDHEQIILRALKRANVEIQPSWLRSYYLTDLSIKARFPLIKKEMERALKECKTIYCVLLDGVGDLIPDTNHVKDSTDLVAELHALAIKYATVIICVLHENPDSTGKGNVKMRGHLGSQLERKSESNIRLTKDKEEITTQSTVKSRHAAIPESRGPRFTFDSDTGHHISVEAEATKKPLASQGDRTFVSEIFANTLGGLTWEQTHQKIEKLASISRQGAEKRFNKYRKLELIIKNTAGFYTESL
jgi:hypothetical protein